MSCAILTALMMNNSNPVLSSLASSFLPLISPSWWGSPNHSPSNHHTYYRWQQCAWRLLQSWWQYYWHHCGFRRSAGTNSTSRLYSKSCIYLTQPCLTWSCSVHSITNSLVLLPLTVMVMGAQVDWQLRKDVDSINLFAPLNCHLLKVDGSLWCS